MDLHCTARGQSEGQGLVKFVRPVDREPAAGVVCYAGRGMGGVLHLRASSGSGGAVVAVGGEGLQLQKGLNSRDCGKWGVHLNPSPRGLKDSKLTGADLTNSVVVTAVMACLQTLIYFYFGCWASPRGAASSVVRPVKPNRGSVTPISMVLIDFNIMGDGGDDARYLGSAASAG